MKDIFNHQMIKADPLRYMGHGDEISQNIKKEGKTSVFGLKPVEKITQNIYLQEFFIFIFFNI